MKWNIAVLSALLAMALLATVAVAQGMPPGHMHEDGMFGGPMMGMMMDYLDLTDAQQAQIKQIMEKERSTMQPLREQERQSHRAIMQLITSGNFDEAKAQAIAQQAAQVQSQLMVEHARVAAQAYQVLTPEQKTRLKQFMAKQQQRFEQHMQRPENAEPTPNE